MQTYAYIFRESKVTHFILNSSSSVQSFFEKTSSKYLVNTKTIHNFALAKAKDQGKVPEWSIGAVSKTVVPLRVPRVRI
ncbi:MAG: hypothetical protein K2J38_04105, partial [Muribaculaceae bacterium]|nr:hypothetical protein [Muribaculaceae bacterium]